MSSGVRKVLDGRVSFIEAVSEGFRRGRSRTSRRRERELLSQLTSQPARLRPEFSTLSSSELLKHFRERITPVLPGFEPADSMISPISPLRGFFRGRNTERLIESAQSMTKDHRWPLLGFGEKDFGHPIDWHRDPLSGRIWPLDYHADIPLWHNDGSDIRVLWELNRLGHLITLGRAYVLAKEQDLAEDFATEFFTQVESWREQNPVGRGANWSCAMEVALRSINLLAAFSLFSSSPNLNEQRLLMLLTMFDQHGEHIRRNLEFSHVATSNHYLSDIAGLLWLGILLPELSAAAEWREWALAEMLREMDKQILPDGADYEASTGYHRFVLELFLSSFLLCRVNGIKLGDNYEHKLYQMLIYLRGLCRPDGLAPLVGDTDGGQFLPTINHSANDHSYLLAIGELAELVGTEGLRKYAQLARVTEEPSSRAFPDAGTYVLRHEDMYLLFNANGAKNGRPASHRHNDVLSIEVSACGRAFIVDPGTYVYTADLHERHLFRSTAYHSTIKIDEVEQNTIREDAPFVFGDEARARVLSWEGTPEHDRVVAEHSGYERLPAPLTHRRSITFHKQERWWLIEDELLGGGEHDVAARFHFDAGLGVELFGNNSVIARETFGGACLIVRSLDLDQPAVLEPQFTSRHYGSKDESITACWTTTSTLPCKLRWVLVPVRAGDDQNERMTALSGL